MKTTVVVRWDVPLYFLRIRWTLQKLLCSPRQAESITIRYPFSRSSRKLGVLPLRVDHHFVVYSVHYMECSSRPLHLKRCSRLARSQLQKGGVPAAPSGTATLLRLSPSYQFYPRPLLAVTDFRYPRLPWLDGRCVQGPGTYSPRHG